MPSPLQFNAWQDEISFLLPSTKDLLRPDEVAEALGTDIRTVARLAETYRRNGTPELLAFTLNAGQGQREHRRYLRNGVLLHLAASANFQPGDRAKRLVEVLHTCTPAEVAIVHQRAAQLLTAK